MWDFAIFALEYDVLSSSPRNFFPKVVTLVRVNIEERVTENNGNKIPTVSEREYLQRVFGTGDNKRKSSFIHAPFRAASL